MIARIAASFAVAASLAGCATADPVPISGTASGHKCNGADIQKFVGRTASADLGSEMIRVSGAATIRWVPAGTAVTMEFRADRLTVFLDQSNRVERISCS